MIEYVTPKDVCLTIIKDKTHIRLTIVGIMQAPYRLEHWESKKIIIKFNKNFV